MEAESLTRPHLDDGELLCLLDGEDDALPRGGARAHLGGCADCRARMERYRVRRERLAHLLDVADYAGSAPPAGVIPLRPRSAPRPAGWVPWLRAAAVFLLLAAGAALATPARAWIAAWAERQWARLAGTPTAPPPPVEAPAAPVRVPAVPPQTGVQVRFAAGGEMRVEIAHPQAAGALILVPVEGASAAAEVLGAPAVEIRVLPSGVRIRNAPGLSADYRVEVPGGVRRVRVRVGGRRETVVDRAKLGTGGTRLPLAGGG